MTETGSPPRGWGKLLDWIEGDTALRFTPTRVGKTGLALFLGGALTVHPHAGGENARGDVGSDVVERFTPTRVGKTRARVSSQSRENGSPPRGWGKQLPVKRS